MSNTNEQPPIYRLTHFAQLTEAYKRELQDNDRHAAQPDHSDESTPLTADLLARTATETLSPDADAPTGTTQAPHHQQVTASVESFPNELAMERLDHTVDQADSPT